MKKIMFNISDFTYEKLKFESMEEKKSVQQIIEERLFFKKFSDEVEEAFDKKMQEGLEKILKE